MNEELKIGVSVLSGGFQKSEYFGLKPNEDNAYRILPPLFSLADKGQYGKYHASHKIFIPRPKADPNEKQQYDVFSFACIEKKNRQHKTIEVHCPFCDKSEEGKSKYNNVKGSGISEDQLQEFFQREVLAYQAEKKFYVNAVNSENRVGILPLPIKAFKSLQDLLIEIKKKYNIDATGTNGLFLNFRKNQRFPRDRDTNYTVKEAMEQMQDHSFRMKSHTIMPDFHETIKNGARDLSNLFKSITAQDMNNILAIFSDKEALRAAMKTIFSRGENSGKLESSAGGTTMVHRTEVKGGEVQIVSPEQPKVQSPTGAVAGSQPTQSFPVNPFQASQPSTQPQVVQPQATQAPAVQMASGPNATMSDEDFLAQFE